MMALGHDMQLIAPKFVKPYVKNQKNDAADAEAICEAAQRPTMRCVSSLFATTVHLAPGCRATISNGVRDYLLAQARACSRRTA